jgi:hypothetical protein
MPANVPIEAMPLNVQQNLDLKTCKKRFSLASQLDSFEQIISYFYLEQ